jgi:hypothetical protein
MGLLYLWEIPFFISGIYLLAKSNEKWKWIPLIWFFAVPIVGGATLGQPNALRTLPNAVMAAFFSAYGLIGLYSLLKIKYLKKIAIFVMACIIVFSLSQFAVLYTNFNPPLVSGNWGDGEEQMAHYVMQHQKDYNKVYISGDNWRPYTYMLFYMKYPPALYQKGGSRYSFSNFEFGKASWDTDTSFELSTIDLSTLIRGKTLFILSTSDFHRQQVLIEDEKRPYAIKIVDQINGTFVQPAFIAAEIR